MSRSSRAVEVEINCSALQHNLQVVRNLAPQSRLFAVLKSDAYGHGAVQCAEALHGADAFALAMIDEAALLREAGVDKTLLVLQGPRTREDVKLIQHHTLTPVIHDWSQLELLQYLRSEPGVSAWIKVDSGMGRLGFAPAELVRLRAALQQIPGLRVVGLLSHFSSSDRPDDASNQQQLRVLEACHLQQHGAAPGAAVVPDSGDEQSRQAPSLQLSLANSAAVLSHPQSHLDWVRPGIMLYGSNPIDAGSTNPATSRLSAVAHDSSKLRPVMTVRAPLIAIKQMPAGAGIGYGHSYICNENMPVGYVAIGYGDGLLRAIGDSSTVPADTQRQTATGAPAVQPCVSVRGRQATILGRISMDSIAIDLRGHPVVCRPGDAGDHGRSASSDFSAGSSLVEKTLVGETAPGPIMVGEMVEIWGGEQSVGSLAAAAGTLPYELLCSIRGTRLWV